MDERSADSIISARERSAKIRELSAQFEREQAEAEKKRAADAASRDAATRGAEGKDLEQAALLSGAETREMLLDHIREMREQKPTASAPAGYRTESMQRAFTAEQEAGRAAVAKAQAEMERNRAARLQAEAEQQARNGTMTPVHHPNPGMDEQYPVRGGTLGKKQ